MSTADKPNYLDPRVLERIKRLDMRARLVVEGFITGQHKSPFNGFAVEFATHREYAPGDEIKHIDWKVWSKTDRFYIKEYEEETNLKATIILDASKSMAYGRPGEWSKYDYAATTAAALTHLLQQQQDAVGLVTFTNKVDSQLPASGHPNQLKQVVHQLEQTEPSDTTDLEEVFPKLAGSIRQRGLIVLISDLFLGLDTLKEALKRFRHGKHEVVVFHVMHEDEIEFDFDDNTLFKGLEVDAEIHADPRALRKAYLEVVGRYMKDVSKICDNLGVDYALINTHDHLDATLSKYLAFRKKNHGGRRS